MVERRRRHPDVAAPAEHLPEQRGRGPADKRQVVFVWQHDVNGDAPHRRHVERLADGVVGQEIGRHDPHRFLSCGQRPHEHELDPSDVGVVRPIADTAGQHPAGEGCARRPGGVGLGGRSIAQQHLVGSEGPVLRKHLEQLRDDRPAELEVHIADGMPGLVGKPATVADVEAAGKADRTVDDEDLAMVAEVGVGKVDRHARGQEPIDSHPLPRQHADDGGPRVPRADAIDEHADLDAAVGSAGECRGEELSRGVVVEDIGGHADAAGGGIDRGEHPRIGLIAADQRFDLVAVDEWPARHLADERGQRPQGGVVGADRSIEPLA